MILDSDIDLNNVEIDPPPIVEQETNHAPEVDMPNKEYVVDEFDFLRKFNEPVKSMQSTGIDQPIFKPEPSKPPLDPGYIKRTNDSFADIVVGIGDAGIAFLLAHMVAKTGDTEKYSASKEEIKDLQTIARQMMPTDKVPAPPSVQLAMLVAKIYGSKVPDAMKDRRISELEQNEKDMKRKIEMLEYQNKMRELKRQRRKMTQKLNDEKNAPEQS